MRGEGFSVEVKEHPIIWRRLEIACPKCQEVRGLIMSAYAQDPSTVFRCPGNHVWDRDDIPGSFVKAVHEKIEEDPDAPVIEIDMERL